MFKAPPLNLKDKNLLRQDAFVDGKWISSTSRKRFDITDPGSGNTFASCPDMDSNDVDAAIQSSARAFKTYGKMIPRQRAKILMRWYNLIEENRDDMAMLLTFENGKPLHDAYEEIDYAKEFVWWFAGEAERIFGTVSYSALPNRRVFVQKQPIGVCVALVPWNLPIAVRIFYSRLGIEASADQSTDDLAQSRCSLCSRLHHGSETKYRDPVDMSRSRVLGSKGWTPCRSFQCHDDKPFKHCFNQRSFV